MMYNFGGCIMFDNYEQALAWCRGGAPAERALKKRRRIAARLAEVRMRTVAWRLAGTGWTPGGGEQPLWVTP